jgi:Co/Zn/Cd efflux system component
VVLADGYDAAASLDALRRVLHERFGIDHMTIQIEPAGHEACRTSF